MSDHVGRGWLVPLIVGVLVVVGCTPPDQSSGPQTSTTTTIDGGADGCWVHLYDGDDFDELDDNFRLVVPGSYADLADLPGADKDWTDEADSLRVGSEATVMIWSSTGFEGDSLTLAPGSEHPDLAFEPSSLEMTCSAGAAQ